ncbi:UNVERIFIED_CONTAM: hypothetical protein PYX00_007490 [Menopon gallinae]|uniref:Pseudopodium-enriched atypical kinase 1 n=1 Tax=Menopon gallinae TaxID=328185 RepID=A0AAW2HJB0_9NEOP
MNMATTLHCDNFVGNAWKRDLCLNCFKSKEEHQTRNGEIARLPLAIPDPPKEGILKGSKTSRQKGNKVNFLNNECEVIGFGGDVIYSDDEDEDVNNSNGNTDDDDVYDNEEDKAFQKLTKSNTDYNSIPENLQEPKEGEVKKIIEPLKLGKSVLDEKGNKKTLLVSVTPFGDQNNTKVKINRTVLSRVNGAEEKLNGTVLKSDAQLKLTKKEEKVEEVTNVVKAPEQPAEPPKEEPKSEVKESKSEVAQVEKTDVEVPVAPKKKKSIPIPEEEVKPEPQPEPKPSAEETKPEDKSFLLSTMQNKFLSSELKISPSDVETPKEKDYSKLVPNVSSLYKTVPKPEEEKPENEKREPEEKDASFERFQNIERLLKGEEITLFSKKADSAENVPELSRESAGEPDGKADSDDPSDPPALPLNPPPEIRSNFLQDLKVGGEFKLFAKKPKVPAKPIIVHSKKTNFQSPLHSARPKSPSIEKFLDITSSPVQTRSGESTPNGGDSIRVQKRQAPKPPSPKEDAEDRPSRVFPETETPKQDIPTESIRRISRSTENLLELITDKQDKADMISSTVEEISVPEPSPRRSLSLSQDSLLTSGIGEVQSKKKSSRGRFSLRKLLHLGKSKGITKEPPERNRSLLPPISKPKLEIIHPSEFNGARVEVLPPARTSKSRRSSSSASSSSGEQKESEVLSDSSTSHSVSSSGNDSHTDKTKKPVLPPRAQSLECWNNRASSQKGEKLRQPGNYAYSGEGKQDSLYVNLGEARSGLAPNKPVRTGSLREQNMENTKRFTTSSSSSQPEDSGYESFDISFSTLPSASSSLPADDNVYECVQVQNRSSSPECDSAILDSPSYSKTKRALNGKNYNHRRSEGNFDLSQDYFKMKFMRSVSLPYCTSETESEIYSPYSFYESEMGDDDCDTSPNSARSLRISRLKLKKGRSVVHKNLEDNYGAVVIANHEALAQVVEQMRQGPSVPPALRALCNAANLRWSDFTIAKDAAGVVVERRVFYPAYWGACSVTLSLTAEQGLNSSLKGPFHLNPLTELNDLVPASYLPMLKKDPSTIVQASISVLTRLQIETLSTYGKAMSSGVLNEESKKEVNFVLLQIINALKSLQAQGIEEAPSNLTNLIVCREDRDPHPRICLTSTGEQTDSECSLCQCVLNVVTDILPPTDLTNLVSSILRKEKAVSLSQAKSILEFTLWGPSDIVFGNTARELSLQRWLDLERATVLHGLVRTRAELTVFEEWHLLFLVRTNAKMMAEASVLLESGNPDGNLV